MVDENGNLLSDFDGEVYPKVYDKSITYQTLGQDASPILDFDLQNALIFKGKSSVVNGEFAFEFIVPKDISYNYGNGKVSLYAVGTVNGELTDAAVLIKHFLSVELPNSLLMTLKVLRSVIYQYTSFKTVD